MYQWIWVKPVMASEFTPSATGGVDTLARGLQERARKPNKDRRVGNLKNMERTSSMTSWEYGSIFLGVVHDICTCSSRILVVTYQDLQIPQACLNASSFSGQESASTSITRLCSETHTRRVLQRKRDSVSPSNFSTGIWTSEFQGTLHTTVVDVISQLMRGWIPVVIPRPPSPPISKVQVAGQAMIAAAFQGGSIQVAERHQVHMRHLRLVGKVARKIAGDGNLPPGFLVKWEIHGEATTL
jgi:hypothetical protein